MREAPCTERVNSCFWFIGSWIWTSWVINILQILLSLIQTINQLQSSFSVKFAVSTKKRSLFWWEAFSYFLYHMMILYSCPVGHHPKSFNMPNGFWINKATKPKLCTNISGKYVYKHIYKKNVNRKCSMWIIKGCTGKTHKVLPFWGAVFSLPRGDGPLNSSQFNWLGPLRIKQSALKIVFLTEGSGKLVRGWSTPPSLRHGEKETHLGAATSFQNTAPRTSWGPCSLLSLSQD